MSKINVPKEPESKLSKLRSGNCFIFNRQPYIVISSYWEDLVIIKRKMYVCRMKFEDYDTHFSATEDIYHISRGLFDILVK